MNNDFELYLQNVLNYIEDEHLRAAMNYSLLSNGKRVRPNLLFNILDDYQEDKERAYPIAAAIEMIHTYSLIHDDLPAMDNDDYRRGKLTNHKKFDEATAILAGDALLTEAFTLVSRSDYDGEVKANIMLNMARLAGANGMVRGQDMDLNQNENTSLLEQDEYKTGCLLALPLICGAIIADDFNNIEELEMIGKKFGLIFQIQDDLIEVKESNTSDTDNHKLTYVSVYGENKCMDIIHNYYDDIQKMVKDCDRRFEHVLNYLQSLEKRTH